MKIHDNDKLIFIKKEQCYPDFLQRLLDDKDNAYEIATKHIETINLIRTDRIRTFPIRKRTP